jgi:hypothetical protein
LLIAASWPALVRIPTASATREMALGSDAFKSYLFSLANAREPLRGAVFSTKFR